ncbi:uncharacterized protein N7479_001839 [Penicillium vulpinum]|uniref:Uncharacterized protein n=1 Tax=Penicillium vulpinum TaxID=29845 RepID=A0A1V6S440_9EURO|nr:uncharacterized protein N7479_001839 [Penicillium vulpinum]KAJ5971921.1 hypothetical protein N7479_001839 [Penicillium vulpinum]OQE08812.1 hypothetical protein PENVUL_c008G07968 [Penicillium vulpinum]
MPSITISDGYTFNNWGPVTTTFTAPASCATAGDILIQVNTSFPVADYWAQCSTDSGHGCIPTGTVSPPITLDSNPSAIYDYPYYSPGLYCPSGWATVGVAARDGDRSPSLSGILSVSSTTKDSRLYDDYATWKSPATMLPELLDPSETLVMCCPSSMTAIIGFGCYSTVSDYAVTTGCLRILDESNIGTSTKTYAVNGTTSTDLLVIMTASYPDTTETTTFDPSELDRLVALSVMPILPLVHHQSDIKTTGTSGAAFTKATSTSTLAATSNSAARVAPKVNSWDGLGGVLGVSLAAIVLGAAMIFQ